jgi:hypothetical protein
MGVAAKFENVSILLLDRMVGEVPCPSILFKGFPCLRELLLQVDMELDAWNSLAYALPTTVKFLTVRSIPVCAARSILNLVSLTVFRATHIEDEDFERFATEFRFPRQNPEYFLVRNANVSDELINGVRTVAQTAHIFNRPIMTKQIFINEM